MGTDIHGESESGPVVVRLALCSCHHLASSLKIISPQRLRDAEELRVALVILRASIQSSLALCLGGEIVSINALAIWL
jgi:hypothetical protein